MLRKSTYDAVVSDHDMPGCNGVGLLRYIRRTDPHIPFLFFSDQMNEEVVLDALTAGADFFLPKGVQVRPQFIQLEHAIRESVMRRRAEREQDKLSSVLRLKEAIVRSSVCAIAMCDTEGRIRHANPASLALWGYADEEEVIGRSALEFVLSPEIQASAIPDLLQQRTWSGQAVCRKKDGSSFEARVYVNTMIDDSGSLLGFVASVTDLSRQRHARLKLESYIREVRFVSEKAAEMAEFPLEGDIYGFIADALSRLVPTGAIVIASSVKNDATVTVETVRGPEIYVDEIERVIGRPLAGLTVQATEEGVQAAVTSSFTELDGVSTLTFGNMPPEACRALEELPFMGSFLGTGLLWKGRVIGVSAIIFPPGMAAPVNIDLLDLFIRHCSAVLRQRQAERVLQGSAFLPIE
jgi:PAS domain S-box-containing protein